MNSTIRTSELSRRQVMIGAAGLSVAFAIRPADAAVLATAIRLVASHITPEHRDAARAALERGIDREG